MDVLGIDRIMFSVDYPFSANEDGRAFLENTSISLENKEIATVLKRI
jgi:hypothetical protein